MLDAREAAKAAKEFLDALFLPSEPKGVQLEEVELDDDRTFWLITLSHVDPDTAGLGLYPTPRKYKTFTVKTDSGEVMGMKIRQLG